MDWREYKSKLCDFLANELESNESIKDMEEKVSKTIDETLKSNKKLTDSILQEYGDLPIKNHGRYKDVLYKDLVDQTLDKFNEDEQLRDINSSKNVSYMIRWHDFGGIEELVSNYSDKQHIRNRAKASLSPLDYVVNELGKYNPKSFDDELVDLVLMEYEVDTGKTISDSEWSKLIEAYKKS